MMKPIIIYVKQCYSLPGLSIQTPCASCESLATVIDLNNNNNNELQLDDDDDRIMMMKPLLCACPISIEILMILSLKSIPMDVKLCNGNKMLPEELRIKMIHQLPVFVDTNNFNRMIQYNQDIVNYIQQNYPNKMFDFPIIDRLNPFHDEQLDWELITSIHQLNRKFYHYIQQQFYQQQQQQQKEKKSTLLLLLNDLTLIRKQLINAIKHLNTVLTWFGTRYAVTDQHPTTIDCHLMPRLHQIRVLLEYLDNETIPVEFRTIWQYLSAAYKWNVFRRWCPSDQEILIHWIMKTKQYSRQRLQSKNFHNNKFVQLIRSKPTFTLDCPNNIEITQL